MSTMATIPFPCPLLQLNNFTNRMVWDDTLHVAYRGFAPNFVAAALGDLFGRGQALTKACSMAHAWARLRGHELSLDELSLSDERFPSLNAKGWDVKLLCIWLVFGPSSFCCHLFLLLSCCQNIICLRPDCTLRLRLPRPMPVEIFDQDFTSTGRKYPDVGHQCIRDSSCKC